VRNSPRHHPLEAPATADKKLPAMALECHFGQALREANFAGEHSKMN
jgi:hypothetical protein